MRAGTIGRGVLAVLALALALCVAPAGAAVREGVVTDPANDGAGPGRDITGARFAYDPDAGTASVEVTFAAAPSASAQSRVLGVLGTRQPDGTCVQPAAGLVGLATGGTVELLADDDGGGFVAQGTGAGTLSGAVLTATATAGTLTGKPYDCAFVGLAEAPGDPDATYDGTQPVALAAPAPPPAPTPAPAPAPSAAPKPAALSLTVTRAPARATRNRWLRVRVRLTNTGGAAARSVQVEIARARGVKVRRAKPLKTLAPGAAKTVTLHVRLSRRLPTTLLLRAGARGGAATSAKLTLRRRPPRGSKPGGGLAGRYFWRFVSRVDYAWENHGVAFLDGEWAYRGIPKGGLPACTKVTAGVDEDGDPTDGCLRYRYDAKTGAVTVGEQAGSFRDGKLELGEDSYFALTIPKPGSRYDVSLHHQGFSGMCGLVVGCTTWQYFLTLRPDGQFALSSLTLSSMGGGGFPFTAAWSAPPDEHGTYEVLSGGRIRLSFADGSVSVRTIGIEQDDAGRPAPSAEGLLLDDTNYYPDSD